MKHANTGFCLPAPNGTPCYAKNRCAKPVLESSHFATLTSLVVAIVYWTSLNLIRLKEHEEMPWSTFLPGLVLLLTIMYYYTGTWLIEGKLRHHLDELQSNRLCKIEPWIRGGILAVMALLLILMEFLPPAWLLPAPFLMLVVWDHIIEKGGKAWIARLFKKADYAGLILSSLTSFALLCLDKRRTLYTPVCILLLILMLIFVMWQFRGTWERLTNDQPIIEENLST